MMLQRFAQAFRNERTKDRVTNNLGIIHSPGTVRRYRLDALHELDKIYDGAQYDGLLDWDEANASHEYIPVRRRKPRVQWRLAKRMADEIGSKLFGEKVAPRFEIDGDPEATYFFKLLAKVSRLRPQLMAAAVKATVAGSCFVRFYFAGGKPVLETYQSKWCYPLFSANGDLESIQIRWVWTDTMDLDEKGKPREKWGQLFLSRVEDILFNTPVVEHGQEPAFEEVGRVQHNLGFVQGEWFRTTFEMGVPDGQSLIEPAESFFCELDYSASQSSQAVSYNQDPIPLVSGMDVDSIEELIRASSRAWNLGRDGEARFLESGLTGVQVAMDMRDKIKQGVQDVTRILLMDPEKIMGSAQSGRALEILHAPLMDIVYTLREAFEPSIESLLTKMAGVAYLLGSVGQGTITIPPGWAPTSLEPSLVWPDVFPETIEDLQKRVQVASSAANASLISRETAMRWLAESFDIEDIELELERIAAQPVLNPFGMF